MPAKKTPLKASDKQIAVIDRRLQAPTVFGEGSVTPKLKDPGWVTHTVNTQLRPGRYHDVVASKGWVPVLPEDVDGDPADFGFDIKDGRVVRGERGTEVLMKMPAEFAKQIAFKKAEENTKSIRPTRLKRAIVEQAGAELADQAADFLDRSVTIKSERAPVPLESLDSEDGSA